MNDVRIEFTRTRGDILKGITANVLHSPWVLVRYGIGALVVSVVALFVTRDSDPTTMVVAAGFAFVAMLLLYAMILALSIFLAARKTWKAPGGLDPITLTFTGQGLRAKASVAEGASNWIVWKSAFETRSLIVIRHEFNLVHIIPKRGISEESLAAIRAVLVAHVAKTRMRS